MARNSEQPRLVLHAGMTNVYWFVITACVIALVALPSALLRMWREQPSSEVLVFGGVVAVALVLAIVHAQRKARWVVADARGLTITERSHAHLVPWRDVRSLKDLGLLGAAPFARRTYVEFADGQSFTFLADTQVMARLDALREQWGIQASR